jgi:hypothetical protein
MISDRVSDSIAFANNVGETSGILPARTMATHSLQDATEENYGTSSTLVPR